MKPPSRTRILSKNSYWSSDRCLLVKRLLLMLWTAPPTGRASALELVADEATRIRRSSSCWQSRQSASTSRRRSSGSWGRFAGQRRCPPTAEAPVRARVLQEASVLSGGYRGLRNVASLVARAAGARPYGLSLRLRSPMSNAKRTTRLMPRLSVRPYSGLFLVCHDGWWRPCVWPFCSAPMASSYPQDQLSI